MIEATFGRISKHTGKICRSYRAIFTKKFDSVEDFVRFKVNCRYAVALYYTGCLDRATRHIILNKSSAMLANIVKSMTKNED